MSLTKEDLLAISQLLDVKFQTELQPIKNELAALRKDVTILKDDVAVLKTEVASLKQDVATLKTEFASLKDDVAVLKTEVASLKQEVDLLKQNVRKIEIHLENVTDKNIALLFENYVPAANSFANKSEQIDAMQTDINMLKKVVAEHSAILNHTA